MTYLSTKKIYPGNWVEALNGWYKNIDTTGGTTVNASKDGPTAVLATPGYRYYQQRGYVPVSWASGSATTLGQTLSVIVPSPYRQDDTRPDITGMVISGNANTPAFVYRTAISIASGWGDGRVASGVYASSGNVLSFGRNVSGLPIAASGTGEGVIQANIASTVSGLASGTIYISGGTEGFGSFPFLTATGAAGVSGTVVNYQATGATTLSVFTKASGNAVSGSGGVYISDADIAAGRTGYILVEVAYIVPDDAPHYEDLEAYLPNRTVS